ncbi:Piso0_003642 [Millerozyma farinosa CBS 7064]|uniref:Mitogen-activated protein kinase n=1 Tax=Pichia sorbitophila (strain ATCC MYA-4447 / BCRC 22081 / CBS 7064 / NBRC 10061 / NRRL Y-12695) TaxID=559304 RepID=G8YGH1_PICSO|nr:Piso0_003642 [Millerozyma farinosa CBS 7064]CCE81288.1 Piso0_003642 [Millerozyma farinosa CBS 7064]
MSQKNPYSDRVVTKVFNQDFVIDKRFKIVKELGHGAYGIVCSAKYEDGSGEDGCYVAIKKITNIFSKKILCKRSLRELKLLQFFRGHKNITCLYDLDIIPDPVSGDFNEIYLYEELMECDMHQIIRSGQPLTDSHYQFFIYQTLCGLKYIHSADVLHRDLKPGNLLVNADCELKICDFGLARGFSEIPEHNVGFMTEYVATRWYRAPEIMLSFTNYTKAIDVWSVGCILAELLGGKPLFRGKDYVDQLNQILLVLGTPSESTLTKIGSVRAQNYVRSLPFMKKVPFSKLFTSANPLALDLLEKMLTLDPYERISVEEALNHPYLAVWHDPQDEPECQVKFDFKSFETIDDMTAMKELIINEVKSFREFVRKPLDEQQRIFEQQHTQYDEDSYLSASVGGNQSEDVFPTAIGSHLPSGNQNGVSTDTTNLANDSRIEFYESMPKPQELDEFAIGNYDKNLRNAPNYGGNNDNIDLFRLEEELGYGLDGASTFQNM